MMRSRAGLYVLGLLCIHSAVFGQEAVEFCDDPSVKKAVRSAVHKFNENLTTGNKLALFQILTASKSENSTHSVYSLQFTTRRSDCPAGDSKPWTDCDYLATGHRSPISCNATVYMTKTETDTKQVYCFLDDHAFPEKAHCLGCPEDINENSEDLKVPLSVSVSKYNSISDSTHLFNLHFVGHATRQVVAGFRFKVSFDMRKTTCAKTEHKELNELCLPDDENVVFAHCNSTVDVAPWRHELPVANIKCEPGALPQLNTRRRPPGWSPLRNFIRPTPLPSQPSAVDPTKKESSEEDETGTKSPPGVASVAGAADAAIDSPFHCPSKPWKPFHPVLSALPVAPVNATVKVASPPPSGDGAFSDIDLVG